MATTDRKLFVKNIGVCAFDPHGPRGSNAQTPMFVRQIVFDLWLPCAVWAPSLDSPFVTSPPSKNLEDWIQAQNPDPDFADLVTSLPGAAIRNQLYIYAPDDREPKILVPPTVREPLVRTTHVVMCHLGSAKVHSAMSQSCYWPNMAADCRRWLTTAPVVNRKRPVATRPMNYFPPLRRLHPESAGAWIFRAKVKP